MFLLCLAIFLLLICLLTWVQVYHDKTHSLKSFYVSPILFLNIGWVLYGFGPLLFFGNSTYKLSQQDSDYIIVILASTIFWCLGLFVGASATSKKQNQPASNIRTNDLILEGSIRYIIAIFLMIAFYVYKLYDSPIQYFTQQYGFYNSENVSSVVSSIPFIVAGVIFYLVSYRRSDVVVVFCLLVAIFFALGGNRNIFAFIITGMLFSVYRNKKVRASLILFIVIAIIITASFLAVAREYGIGTVITGAATDFSMSEVLEFSKRYNEGEFGTMYRTVGYINEKGGDFDYYFPSFSYVFSPIVNLIPTSLFPDRPNTIATEFTFYYWGGKGDFVEGLGFSPIAEGITNFGYVFFIIPIFIIAIVLTLISIRSMNLVGMPKCYWQMFATCVAAASLNFFRIDFAIYTKFIFISFASAAFALKLSKTRFGW